MVKQYPHILKYVPSAEEAEQDENGNWITPNPDNGSTAEIEIECRAEANDKGRKIAGVDGDMFEFQFVVYLKKSVTPISVNQTIEVYDAGILIAKANVARFHKGQLNARLWV